MSESVLEISKRKYGEPLPEPENGRFTMADLGELAPWLLERLRKRYALANDRVLMDFLRGIMEASDHIFLRSKHAVACARITQEPLLTPRVEEVFVLAAPGFEDEAAGLYEPMRRWAFHRGIETIRVNVFTDVPRKTIMCMLGRVFVEEVFHCRVVRGS